MLVLENWLVLRKYYYVINITYIVKGVLIINRLAWHLYKRHLEQTI